MRKWLLSFLLLIGFACRLNADMGAIVPAASVSVSEPGQRGIIAHDGFEEILILATDFKANTHTKVLRFIPFASRPTVKPAPKDCFNKLGNIIQKHRLAYLVHYKMMMPHAAPAIEITSHQKIGAHDVTVIKVNKPGAFANWANTFFAKNGLSERPLTSRELMIIKHYLKKGFRFFVFDVVNLSPDIHTITPLAYQFKTRYLYYPLVTSNLMVGSGEISLFIISETGISNLPPYWQNSTSAVISAAEMQEIYKPLARLMGTHAILQALRYRGKLHFNDDLRIKMPIFETKPYYPHFYHR